MKRFLLQFVGLLLLTGAAGTVYNRTTVDSERHIEFFSTYRNARVCTQGTGETEVTDSSDPSSTGEKPSPEAPGDPENSPPPVATEVEQTPSTKGLPRVLHDEAFELWEGEALFIDARRTPKYEAGHIPGAVSISPWEAGRDAKISKLVETEVHEAPVVVYCTASKDCEDSHMIGEELRAAGFVDVYVYLGGFPDWRDNDKPFVTGPEPGPRGRAPEQAGGDEGAE